VKLNFRYDDKSSKCLQTLKQTAASVIACSLQCSWLSQITALRIEENFFFTGFASSYKYFKRYTQALSITKITHIKRTEEVKYFSGSTILLPFLEH